jgi:hypothetical protein
MPQKRAGVERTSQHIEHQLDSKINADLARTPAGRYMPEGQLPLPPAGWSALYTPLASLTLHRVSYVLERRPLELSRVIRLLIAEPNLLVGAGITIPGNTLRSRPDTAPRAQDALRNSGRVSHLAIRPTSRCASPQRTGKEFLHRDLTREESVIPMHGGLNMAFMSGRVRDSSSAALPRNPCVYRSRLLGKPRCRNIAVSSDPRHKDPI